MQKQLLETGLLRGCNVARDSGLYITYQDHLYVKVEKGRLTNVAVIWFHVFALLLKLEGTPRDSVVFSFSPHIATHIINARFTLTPPTPETRGVSTHHHTVHMAIHKHVHEIRKITVLYVLHWTRSSSIPCCTKHHTILPLLVYYIPHTTFSTCLLQSKACVLVCLSSLASAFTVLLHVLKTWVPLRILFWVNASPALPWPCLPQDFANGRNIALLPFTLRESYTRGAPQENTRTGRVGGEKTIP